MNRAERRRGERSGSGSRGSAHVGEGRHTTAGAVADDRPSALLQETLDAAAGSVWEAAHNLAGRTRAVQFGISTTMAFPAVGVTVGDGKREWAAACLPADGAVDVLEDIADMLEAHGYPTIQREWREQQPEAWEAVRAERAAQATKRGDG